MSLAKITVEARLATDIKTAWDTYTNPEHIINWNFAADDWCCPSASNDMRVGGKYSARMEAKDGSFGFDFEATYDEVIDGQQFTYTMPDGRVVTTKFEEAGGEVFKLVPNLNDNSAWFSAVYQIARQQLQARTTL